MSAPVYLYQSSKRPGGAQYVDRVPGEFDPRARAQKYAHQLERPILAVWPATGDATIYGFRGSLPEEARAVADFCEVKPGLTVTQHAREMYRDDPARRPGQ